PESGFTSLLSPLTTTPSVTIVGVPLYFDPLLQRIDSDSLLVGVYQDTGPSNGVPFTILAPVPPSVPTASVTLEMLQGALDFIPQLATFLNSNSPSSANFQTSLDNESTNLSALLHTLNGVISGSNPASLGSLDGTQLNVSADDLAESDLILGAMIAALSNTS